MAELVRASISWHFIPMLKVESSNFGHLETFIFKYIFISKCRDKNLHARTVVRNHLRMCETSIFGGRGEAFKSQSLKWTDGMPSSGRNLSP